MQTSNNLRYATIGLLLIFAAVIPLELPAGTLPLADKVLVKKSVRKLYLIRNGQVFREYDVMLGQNPVGHKQQRGDGRTPEGLYRIDYRNAASQYYLSLHISYPNRADKEAARKRGVHPGGAIMIHGLPNGAGEDSWDYIERDWTDGCIVLANPQIKEIWDLVKDGTPIEILP